MRVTGGSANILINAEDDEARQIIAKFIEQLTFIMNGNVGILDNLKVESHKISFSSSSASLDYDLRHGLGRNALGYFVVRKSGNFNVYDGINDWNQNSVFLRSSAVGSATVLVF